MPTEPMSPAQCRAARAILKLSQNALALEAKVAVMTVSAFEAEKTDRPQRSTVEAMQRALERAGAAFIEDDGRAGQGVRLAASALAHT